MRKIKFLAQVDVDTCIGCGACQTLCPTEAARVVEKKAQVDESKCVACPNCSDFCPVDAITMVPRAEPRIVYLDYSRVDPDKITELCRKANLHPHQWGCMCNGTRVREVAAAVLLGAKTLEEIALMTGIRSGCTAYCVHHMLRLLKAHGVEVEEPKNHRWYNSIQTIWETPKEVEEKYPGHFFEEDRKIFRKF